MVSPINIGVDFGSLGWRAAYMTGQQTVVVPCDGQDPLLERRLWPEPSQSPIGISFPSFKSKLGTGTRLVLNGNARSADELATEDLIALSQRIAGQSSQTIGQAVISVPANYSASRRTALREAALKAGFADVQLLNDSMAAVINFTSQNDESATLLVYGMGYAGFEIGLVRSAHGRYRTLGYESGQPGGAVWDESFLAGWWTYFARQNLALVPPPHEWTNTQWLEVRLTAQRVKEALSVEDAAEFPMLVSAPNSTEPLLGRVSRADLETTIAPSINATLDVAERLLADTNLTAKDVDAILLTGGSTRVPLVSLLIEQRFGKKPIALEADAIAKGAAVYASRLETAPAPVGFLGDAVESSADTVDISKAELPISASATTTEKASRQYSNKSWLRAVPMREQTAQSDSTYKNVKAARDVLLAYISYLVRQGEARQAKLFIQKFGQDAHALFEEVPPLTQPATREDINPLKQQRAERAIAQAYQLLKEHKEEEAVLNSHFAWQTMPDSPDIFDQMIDIHCRAGMAKIEIESYNQSCKWLECALSHDQSNSRTREALAERHYLHAKQMAERGKRKEAQRAIEQCLHWNPEHEKGVELRAKYLPTG